MTRLFHFLDRPRIGWPVLVAILLICGFPAARAATLEIVGPDGASIVINDRIMGFLPLSRPLELPPGDYRVRSELPGYQPFETMVHLHEVHDWQQLQVRPSRLSKRVAWTGNVLFAGLGQHYTGHSFKGYLFNLAEAGGLLTALAGELQRSTYRKDYLLFKDRYDNAIHPDDLDNYRLKSEQAYQDMEDMESLRDTGLVIAGGAIVLSILDVLINFPGVATGPGEIPVQTGSLPSGLEMPDGPGPAGLGAVHAAIRLGF